MFGTSLGFETPEVPMQDLQRVRDVMLTNSRVDQKQDVAFVEVCCGTNSALREACKVARMPYIGIVKRMETADMFQKVKEFVEVHQQLGSRWVHVHASTPCSSGSPLKNFSAEIESEADRSWKGIMENVSKYLLLGNSRSFELPRNNNIWKREETKRVLKQCGLQFDAEVFLCHIGMQAPNGLPIGKVLIFFCSASAGFYNLLTKRFGWCECEKHAGMYDVNWTATGVYNKELAMAILAAVRAGRKDPWACSWLCMSHGTTKTKQFFLTCMLHDFPKEVCVAGGTDLFYLCTSPDDARLKGGCAENLTFWFCDMFEPKMFFACFFQSNLKPNDSDVKHYSPVKHSFVLFAKHWRTRNTAVMWETVVVKELHWCRNTVIFVQSCLHVYLFCHWTHVDRVGQNFCWCLQRFGYRCKSEQCLQN